MCKSLENNKSKSPFTILLTVDGDNWRHMKVEYYEGGLKEGRSNTTILNGKKLYKHY